MLEIMEYMRQAAGDYTDIAFHRDVLEGEAREATILAEVLCRATNATDRKWTFWQYGDRPRRRDQRRGGPECFYGSEREWKRWLASPGAGS
jgi:hypothetical protein